MKVIAPRYFTFPNFHKAVRFLVFVSALM